MAIMFMMIGPSYSGKSTIAEKYKEKYNAQIFSSDAIRKELYGDASEQRDPQQVFNLLHKRLKNRLKSGENAIYDATNLTVKRRIGFLKEIDALELEVKKIAVVVVATPNTMSRRVAKRERVVPWPAVERQIKQFQCPGHYEGWNDIVIEATSTAEERAIFFKTTMELAKAMSHDNPHHTYDVDKHMLETAEYARKHYKLHEDYGANDLIAFRYHDIGKVYTKTFVDHRGNPTKIAHYYGHENYGAYIMLLWPLEEYDSIRMAILLQWHMAHYSYSEKRLAELYDWMKEEGTYKALKILEEADVNAH